VRRIAALSVGIVAWLAGSPGCGLDALDIVAIGCPCPKGYACSPNGVGCIVPGGPGGGAGGGGGGVAMPDSGSLPPDLDAGSADGGPMTVDPCSAYPDAIFCSGFEDPTFPEFTNSRAQGGTFGQDLTRSFRGRGSLRSTTTAPSGFAALLAALEAPIVSGTVYLRAYMYVPSTSSNDTNAFFLGHTDENDVAAGLDLDLAATERPEIFVLGYGDYAQSPTVVVPRDRWFCYQAEIAVAETDGAVTVSIDSAPAVTISGVTTSPPGGLGVLSVGIGWTSDAPVVAEIYYDQVVLDDAPLPCEMIISPL
jgi:hypothetical protein